MLRWTWTTDPCRRSSRFLDVAEDGLLELLVPRQLQQVQPLLEWRLVQILPRRTLPPWTLPRGPLVEGQTGMQWNECWRKIKRRRRQLEAVILDSDDEVSATHDASRCFQVFL